MSTSKISYPELVFFEDYKGDFKTYFALVYSIFEEHFIRSSPLFKGVKVSAQKHPEVDGIHRTFYHITHEGADESNRTPDFRRMERIRFPKFFIENNNLDGFLVWKNQRGKDTRVLILSEEQDYLVVLTERKDYYLFWTAFLLDKPHSKRKLIKEYEEYIKTKTA
jgi:hypothetical protein